MDEWVIKMIIVISKEEKKDLRGEKREGSALERASEHWRAKRSKKKSFVLPKPEASRKSQCFSCFGFCKGEKENKCSFSNFRVLNFVVGRKDELVMSLQAHPLWNIGRMVPNNGI